MSPSRDRAGVFHPDFEALIYAYCAWVFMFEDGCEGPILVDCLNRDRFWLKMGNRHSRH